jgi:hypothetical protein
MAKVGYSTTDDEKCNCHKCHECGEQWKKPARDIRFMCTLNQAFYHVIPSGQHIHLDCPVHGSHRIDGSDITSIVMRLV